MSRQDHFDAGAGRAPIGGQPDLTPAVPGRKYGTVETNSIFAKSNGYEFDTRPVQAKNLKRNDCVLCGCGHIHRIGTDVSEYGTRGGFISSSAIVPHVFKKKPNQIVTVADIGPDDSKNVHGAKWREISGEG